CADRHDGWQLSVRRADADDRRSFRREDARPRGQGGSERPVARPRRHRSHAVGRHQARDPESHAAVPVRTVIEQTALRRHAQGDRFQGMSWGEAYQRSLEDPAGFWEAAAADIDWFVPPKQILDDSRSPFTRWFTDGELNTSYNALDRHPADRVALIYDSPV